MKIKKETLIKISVVALFVFVGLAVVGPAFAADGTLQYVPLAPLPGIGPNGAPISDLRLYLESIIRLAIGLAAVFAVVMITIGGVQYMSTDAINGKSEGKERIEQAILGLLLAIGAWLILNTVNPKTLEFNFNPTPTPTTTQTPVTVGTTNPTGNTPTNGALAGRYDQRLYCYSSAAHNDQPMRTYRLFPYYTNQGSRAAALTECNNARPATVPANNCPSNTVSTEVRCVDIPISGR